jgi:hypothetical protein
LNAYQVMEKDGDWAILVFAPTAQRARIISYGTGFHEPCGADAWTIWQARRIKNLPLHLAALDTGKEQVIEDPPTCLGCGYWGGEPVPNTDLCSHCLDDWDLDPNPCLATYTFGDVTVSVASSEAGEVGS